MVTMKIFLLVALSLIASALALTKEENDPVLRGTYTTRLNHFDPQDHRSVNLVIITKMEIFSRKKERLH